MAFGRDGCSSKQDACNTDTERQYLCHSEKLLLSSSAVLAWDAKGPFLKRACRGPMETDGDRWRVIIVWLLYPKGSGLCMVLWLLFLPGSTLCPVYRQWFLINVPYTSVYPAVFCITLPTAAMARVCQWWRAQGEQFCMSILTSSHWTLIYIYFKCLLKYLSVHAGKDGGCTGWSNSCCIRRFHRP